MPIQVKFDVAEIVEVDLIADRTVTDQTVVAVTSQLANQDLAQDPNPPPDKNSQIALLCPMPKYDLFHSFIGPILLTTLNQS